VLLWHLPSNENSNGCESCNPYVDDYVQFRSGVCHYNLSVLIYCFTYMTVSLVVGVQVWHVFSILFLGCWAYLTHWPTLILCTMSIGKLESLLHLLTEILQQFVIHFDISVFSCGIPIPLLLVMVVLCVCVCVCTRTHACMCTWYCHISYSKENITFKVLNSNVAEVFWSVVLCEWMSMSWNFKGL